MRRHPTAVRLGLLGLCAVSLVASTVLLTNGQLDEAHDAAGWFLILIPLAAYFLHETAGRPSRPQPPGELERNPQERP